MGKMLDLTMLITKYVIGFYVVLILVWMAIFTLSGRVDAVFDSLVGPYLGAAAGVALWTLFVITLTVVMVTPVVVPGLFVLNGGAYLYDESMK